MAGANRTVGWAVAVPQIAGAVAIISGALVVVGWQFDLKWLRDPLPGVSSMVPTAATCFMFCGASLLLQLWEPVQEWRAALGKGLAVLVLVYSTAILLEYLLRVDLHIDDKLFPRSLAEWPLPVFPGRFAPNTATAFPMLALALLLLGRKAGRVAISEVFATLAGLIAFISVVGYAYHVEALYSAGTRVQMALHTALVFAVTSAGVFLARPNMGAAQLSVNTGPAGILFRRLLLYTVTVLMSLGWLRLHAQRRGWVDLEFGTALLVVCSVVAFGIAIIRAARLVHEYELGRERATQAVVRTEKLASVGRMAATVAHEINNPLAAATNAVYLLSIDPKLSPESRKHVALADEQLRRVAHLTRQTLGFYRERNAPGVVDICAIADDVLSIYTQRIGYKGIVVKKRYHHDGYIWGIAGELRQVLSNLIANSIDALPSSGGILWIRISRCMSAIEGASSIRITVADNGAGIAAPAQAQVFEPFFTTKESIGTGLGLWVSKDIVTGQNGSVRFRSVEGRGTVFCVFLPAHCAEKEKTIRVTASA